MHGDSPAEDAMQYAIVILDGASGDPVPEFDGKTSFEASRTPNLDLLAKRGSVGMMQNVPAHMVSGSDVACMSIMGYDPAEYDLGRGAIEAAALGIDLKPGQVAFRMNLCYVENEVMRGYSTDNISTEDGNALTAEIKRALDNDVFTLYPGTSFRQILVVNGHPELTSLQCETPHDNTGTNISETFQPKVAEATQQPLADMLVAYMRAANEILAQSETNARRIREGEWPANLVWLFWPGMKPASLRSFAEVYDKTAALNSGVDLLDGLALLTGVKKYKFEGVTDGPTNDFKAQGKGGIQMLEDGNELVIIHVEAPDAAGHDGRPDQKQRSIEESDRHILGPLLKYAEKHPLRIAVMPDHPTPLSTRKHSHDPVPFVIAGPGIAYNGATRLTEDQAKSTGYIIDEGHTFMGEVLFAAEADQS